MTYVANSQSTCKNVNMLANGNQGPVRGPELGMFPSRGSATSGHSSSTATAPAAKRTSAPTATPSTAASAAYNANPPATRQVAGLAIDSCVPTTGSATILATSTEASTMITAHTEENAAHTTAFAVSTCVRF